MSAGHGRLLGAAVLAAIPLWCLPLLTLASPIPSSVPRCSPARYSLSRDRHAAEGGLLQLLARGRDTKDVRTGTAKSLPAPKKEPLPWHRLNLPLAKERGGSGRGSAAGKVNRRNCGILSSKQLRAYSCASVAHSLLEKEWDPEIQSIQQKLPLSWFQQTETLLKPDFFWHLLALLRKSWPGKLARGDELEKL